VGGGPGESVSTNILGTYYICFFCTRATVSLFWVKPMYSASSSSVKTNLFKEQINWGWLSGMELVSYKSQISDGVLVQKQNRTSRWLKSHASVSQCFGTKRTHSCIPGLKGEALFLKLRCFFGVSANHRLVQIRI
jgi:hypothetical protein